jgi:hypothetical protein
MSRNGRACRRPPTSTTTRPGRSTTNRRRIARRGGQIDRLIERADALKADPLRSGRVHDGGGAGRCRGSAGGDDHDGGDRDQRARQLPAKHHAP